MISLALMAETDSTRDAANSFADVWNNIVVFFTSNVWNILTFFVALIFGFILIKTILLILRKIFVRSKMEPIARSFLLNIIKYVLYLLLVIALLAMIGVNVTGIITAISAAILAVGMALQNNISNLAGGMIIVSMHMIRQGDYISVGDNSGVVSNINFLFTTINTSDNKRVMIPNSTLINSPLTNYGSNGTRRVEFTFSVAYESDVEAVKNIIQSVMRSNDKVLLSPKEPFCRLKTLGASSIDFFATCWCATSDYWDVYYYVTEHVFNEFKRAGVAIPYDQAEIRIRTDEVHLPVIEEPLPIRAEEQPQDEQTDEHKPPLIKKLQEIKEILDEDD